MLKILLKLILADKDGFYFISKTILSFMRVVTVQLTIQVENNTDRPSGLIKGRP